MKSSTCAFSEVKQRGKAAAVHGRWRRGCGGGSQPDFTPLQIPACLPHQAHRQQLLNLGIPCTVTLDLHLKFKPLYQTTARSLLTTPVFNKHHLKSPTNANKQLKHHAVLGTRRGRAAGVAAHTHARGRPRRDGRRPAAGGPRRGGDRPPGDRRLAAHLRRARIGGGQVLGEGLLWQPGAQRFPSKVGVCAGCARSRVCACVYVQYMDVRVVCVLLRLTQDGRRRTSC